MLCKGRVLGFGKAIRKFSKVSVGDTYEETRKFSQEDIQKYADLSGDKNPIHLDPDFGKKILKNIKTRILYVFWQLFFSFFNGLFWSKAQKSRFGKIIAHGMLSASLFSSILGTEFPSAIYISQTLAFKSPVFADEEVKGLIKVLSLKDSGVLKVSTLVIKTDLNQIAIEGEAVLLVPTLKKSK
jgi:adenylate kinase